jgi:hypothetical protein
MLLGRGVVAEDGKCKLGYQFSADLNQVSEKKARLRDRKYAGRCLAKAIARRLR